MTEYRIVGLGDDQRVYVETPSPEAVRVAIAIDSRHPAGPHIKIQKAVVETKWVDDEEWNR